MTAPSKEHVLREIRRLADENGGTPLGKARFEALSGIGESVWLGRYWARWSDAVRDAGFQPNEWNARTHDDDSLVRILALLIRDLGFFPTAPDLRFRRRSDRALPNDKVFRDRLGSKAEQVARVLAFADADPEFADVAAICAPLASNGGRQKDHARAEVATTGVVYLIRMAEFYKVGKSNDPGRRMYELGLQLPEKHDVVHVIETDDPAGIEAYWHRRFAAQRTNGEWFRLSPDDVAAFKRRRYM